MGKEQRKASNNEVQDSPECMYYAFISFKHHNNGKYVADAAWLMR